MNSFKSLVTGYVSTYETTAFFVLWGVTVLACLLLFIRWVDGDAPLHPTLDLTILLMIFHTHRARMPPALHQVGIFLVIMGGTLNMRPSFLLTNDLSYHSPCLYDSSCVFVSALCRKRIALQLSVFVSEIVFLLQIIVCLLFMLVTAFLGTLCVRPTYNLVSQIPAGSLQDIALYYSACQGTNIIGNYINKANSSVQTLRWRSLTN